MFIATTNADLYLPKTRFPQQTWPPSTSKPSPPQHWGVLAFCVGPLSQQIEPEERKYAIPWQQESPK